MYMIKSNTLFVLNLSSMPKRKRVRSLKVRLSQCRSLYPSPVPSDLVIAVGFPQRTTVCVSITLMSTEWTQRRKAHPTEE